MSSSESPSVGLRYVLVATVVAGVLGYAVQLLAPALIADEASYVAFSVIWSTLYFGVAAISGVQQEVARAAHPMEGAERSTTLRTFTLWACAAVAVAAVVVAVILGPVILPSSIPTLAVVLVVGLVGYVLTAVLSGVLYGLRLWRAVAAITIIDAVLRAMLVIAGFALGLPTAWLAVMVAVPFGLAFGLVWLWIRRSVIGAFRLDVGLRRLLAHAGSTVGAASASGIMITGLPMLIGVTSAGGAASTVGAFILAITITRAPIVVPVIALQSFLISVVFRGQPTIAPGRFFRLLGIAAVGVGVLAGLGALIGPPVISFISAGRFELSSGALAVIVASAGLVAAMCVTAPALIAARRHTANIVGWVVAAALTILALLLPFDEEVRIGLALTVPPVVGLAVHSAGLLRRPGAESSQDAAAPSG